MRQPARQPALTASSSRMHLPPEKRKRDSSRSRACVFSHRQAMPANDLHILLHNYFCNPFSGLDNIHARMAIVGTAFLTCRCVDHAPSGAIILPPSTFTPSSEFTDSIPLKVSIRNAGDTTCVWLLPATRICREVSLPKE